MEEPYTSLEKLDDFRSRNIYKCIEDLSNCRRDAGEIVQDIEQVLKTTEDFKYVVNDANENKRGETWLHAAIRFLSFRSSQEKRVVELLVAKYPKLILQDRGETEYAGQTPLHMGVCKGNIWSVDCMLKYLSKRDNKHWKVTLLKRRATGSIFRNTVMMAELPLFIAALTFNKGMFDLLLDHGAELDAVNSHGDTVCHALIRYAYLYPDKLEEVLDMCRYIKDDPAPFDNGKKNTRNRKLRRKIWLMENRECRNPLQMAAKFGQHEIFHLIMNLEAYCFENTKDGLFDIKIYDITEIDSIASMSRKEITGIDREHSRKSPVPEKISEKKMESENNFHQKSIIMMLLDLDPRCAFQFIMFSPVRRVIDKKWELYRRYFYPFWLFHFLFMCFLTWHGVEKSQQINNSAIVVSTHNATYEHRSPEFVNEIPSDAFVTSYGIIASVVGILYIIQDVLRVVKGRMPYTVSSFLNPYSNGTFRLIFILFGMLLIIDFGLSWEPKYENYLLVIAILIGWFLIIFFLRGMRPFSFFTVLIQRVLIGDMFRFFVILAIEIIAFSTAMYMVIQGSDLTSDPDFSNFGRIIFAMGKLMVGLGEIDSIYALRHPFFAIIIFVVFIIMTTLLMINALIAMMSRTCSDLVDDVGGINIRDMHWKLQRLSLILFIESILPQSLMSRCGKEQEVYCYNNEIHRRKKVKRYMLEIRSLQNDADNRSETFASSWGFRTAVFNAMGNIHGRQRQRPLSGVSDKIRNFFRREAKSSNQENATVEKSEHVHVQSKQPDSNALPVPQQQEMTPVFAVNGDVRNPAQLTPGFIQRPRAESTPIIQPSPLEVRNVLDIYHVGLRGGRNWSESDLSEY